MSAPKVPDPKKLGAVAPKRSSHRGSPKGLGPFLHAWIAGVLARPRLVIAVAAALAVASIYLTITRMDLKTSQLDLISPKHPLIRLSQKLKPFKGKDSFTVVIQAESPQSALSFVRDLAPALEKDTERFSDVFYRVDPNLLKPWSLLYLKPEEIALIKSRMESYPHLIGGLSENPDLTGFLELVNKEMASRMVGSLFTDFLDKDDTGGKSEQSGPMNLDFLLTVLQGMRSSLDGDVAYHSPWASLFEDSSWDKELAGYFWVDAKKYLLLFVTPVREKETFNRAKASLDHLRDVIRETQKAHPGVTAGVTGGEALKTDEMSFSLGDMSVATWIAFVAVFILMVLFLRTVGRPLIEMGSLFVGVCWTFGWTSLFIGHLNILSMVFAPLLSGLGVDYGIHWFSRFEEEERDPSLDNTRVIFRVVERSGPGIVIAGLTAALSFFPLVLTGFTGLVELGLITGMGILFTLLADFTVLPALSVLFAGRRGKRKAAPRKASSDSKDLIRLGPMAAKLVIATAAAMCLFALWEAQKVSFDLNPLKLQAKSAESVIWEKKLLQKSNRSVMFASSIAGSEAKAARKSKAFEALPTVETVQSVWTLLPENQDAKIPLVRELKPLIDRTAGPFADPQPLDPEKPADILKRIRFKMQDDQAEQWGAERPLVEQMKAVRSVSEDIIEALEPAGGPEPDRLKGLSEYQKRFHDDLVDTLETIRLGADARPMRVEDLPEKLKKRFLSGDEYLIRVYPKEFIWDREPLIRFIADLRSVDPEIIGDPVTLHDFTAAFRSACVNASVYAILAIAVLLVLIFRSLLPPLLALVPLMVGTIWTVGVMGITGMNFNLANSIFLPLIVGAGVEYGVIILHRWREGNVPPGHLARSTAKGVILAALTTTVGFGALMISRHRGIFSLGFVALFGSLCVMLAAVVLLPAILRFCNPPNRDTKGETE